MIKTNLVIAGILIGALLCRPTPEPATNPGGVFDAMAYATELSARATALSADMRQLTIFYINNVHPIETQLLRHAVTAEQARAAAWAVVIESTKLHLSPALIAAILQEENPWLIPDTVSYAGAVGWMQVMPLHVRANHPCGTDLTDGVTNVCYGTTIFREYVSRALSQALHTALLRYNGCVRTPGCEIYAARVMDRALEN